MGSNSNGFEGLYMDEVNLSLNEDPYARYPFNLNPGEHWLIWLSASRTKPGIGSSRLMVTTVLLEFETRADLDQPLDLATMPLQVSYEYGGQVRTYISHTVSGTLTLSEKQGGLQADLIATFSDPVLGKGEQQLQAVVPLEARSRDLYSYMAAP